MRVGVGLPSTVPGTQGQLIIEWASRADEGPFSSLGVLDRMVYDSYDPLITLGAVASHPVEATDAATLLTGQRLTPELITEVVTLAAKRSKPLDNADLTINYRKQVTPVYIRRALTSFL